MHRPGITQALKYELSPNVPQFGVVGFRADDVLALARGEGGATLCSTARRRPQEAVGSGKAAPQKHAARGSHGAARCVRRLPCCECRASDSYNIPVNWITSFFSSVKLSDVPGAGIQLRVGGIISLMAEHLLNIQISVNLLGILQYSSSS